MYFKWTLQFCQILYLSKHMSVPHMNRWVALNAHQDRNLEKETPCLDRKQLHRRRDRQGIETDFRSVSVWQRGVWGLCLSSSGNRYERCAFTRLQMRTIVTAIATETKRKYDRDISMSRVSVSSWNGSEENKTVIKGKTLWNVYGTLKHAPFTPSFNDV